MYTLVRDFPRPDAATLDALRPFPTAILSDAIGRTGTMAAYMRPITQGQRLIGPALTVKTYPADNLMIHLSLKLVQPGDVIVIDADGVTDTAVIGDLWAACARRQGVAGIVVDGAVRDVAEIRGLGLPVYCKASVPNGPLKSGPGDINVPIACGGLIVNPGDIVVGDDDGVVVVPRERIQLAMDGARATEAKEAGLRQRIEAGEILWDILGLDKSLAQYKVEWR